MKRIFKGTNRFLKNIDPRVKYDAIVDRDRTTGRVLAVTAGKTTSLALLQTLYARSLLYYPTQPIIRELSRAAEGLQRLWVQELQQVWREGQVDEIKLALVTRLFGPNGLLPQPEMIAVRERLTVTQNKNGTDTLVTADIRELGPETVRRMARAANDIIEPILLRVIRRSPLCTALDRAVIIAVLGDIGSLLNLTGATGTLRSDADTEMLQHAVTRVARGIPSRDFAHRLEMLKAHSAHAKSLAGSGAIAPAKNKERGRMPSSEVRSGVFNMGTIADSLLNVTDNRLPGTIWSVGLVDEARIYAHEEPFVGHMSGSVAEILVAWEVLAGGVESASEAPLSQWDPTLLGHSHLIPGLDPASDLSHIGPRASATAAFLIAGGFHSAVEVISGILAYERQDSRGAMMTLPHHDAADLFGSGAATLLITEMLEQGIYNKNNRLKIYLEDLRHQLSQSTHKGGRYIFEPFLPAR